MRGRGMPSTAPVLLRPFLLSLTLACLRSRRLRHGGHGSMAGIGGSRCASFLSASSTLFGGNPAAVVLLESWLPDSVLASIAAENNLAETAFVIPGSNEVPLRWFTPTVEVDLCGHATLAAADVLFQHVTPSVDQVTFATRSGNIVVTREAECLTLDFPARPGVSVEVSEELVAALGARPREVFRARDILAILDCESDVQSLRPDFARIAALDAFAVIVSAPGESVDFVSRFFAPGAGIPEDPVTGSAHCTLVPYWAARLGKATLTAKQLSARGGELACRLSGDRVFMSGSTVEYMRGEIDVAI
jgi:PhzF family phenazine biosynthesis protein